MSRTVTTVTDLTNDITGKPLSESDHIEVSFSVDGLDYRLDTDKAGQDAITRAMAKFVKVAIVVEAPTRTATVRSTDAGEARTWLAANGYRVGTRGRLSAELMAAFQSKTVAPVQPVSLVHPDRQNVPAEY